MNLVGLLRDRDGLLNRLALLVLRRDRNRLRNGLKVVDSTARIVGGGAVTVTAVFSPTVALIWEVSETFSIVTPSFSL